LEIMLTANEIRQQFIDFFVKKHGHTFVPSSSVVPLDDPTLMFTNAGMNQFKDVFLGTGTRPYKRAANSQKCIRVSGKHNDLEEVGRDTYHHTFFEMLGNWSFGDYYKAEAIRWAWELLTKEWRIDKSRLHATVFGGDAENGLEPDEEAFRLWTKETDIDPSHVHRFGKKDNFWMMGETGPCGPCSEIHIDLTSNRSGHKLVNAGDPQVIEIWNLVFIQYNLDDNGNLSLLPAKHVDTGMGFERVTALLQGKASNYDTDVFSPLMDAIGQLTGKRYGGRIDDRADIAFRVIADHLRMLTFAITDGALPSNKGRGSVMRSVLRRAVRFGWQCFGQREPAIYKLVPALVQHMGNAFPELKSKRERVADVIKGEESDFLRTIERGLSLFEEAARRAQSASRQISGRDVFDLYTTYGFPPDLTRQMAHERALTIDEEGYEDLMREHKALSQTISPASIPGSGSVGLTALAIEDIKTNDRPKWHTAQAEGRVRAVVSAGPIEGAHPGNGSEQDQDNVATALLLDETCFYAEAGGQVGDKGRITTETGVFEVTNTVKKGDAVLHLGRVVAGRIDSDQTAQLEVSPEREFTRKNHTATHLLHWALRQVLGEHVEQRGSKVKPHEFTFDFSHSGPLTSEEQQQVERLVNERVYQDLSVQWRELPLKEAQRLPGVRAFFGDKYGDVVRVVEIGDGFSREFCGGTHLEHTGQIGFFKVVGEEGVAKGVRRLTCETGPEAVALVQKQERILTELTGRFRCQLEDLPARVTALQDEVKKLQHQLKKGAAADLQGAADKLLADAHEVHGTKLVIGEMPAGPDEQMRQQVDRLRQKAGSAVVLLGWSEDSKVQLIAAVTEDLVKRGVHAGQLVGQVARIVGGGGGGKPTMAQAGGKEPAKLAEALELARSLAREQVSR
jgi:alanyl-tRNA synthetase